MPNPTHSALPPLSSERPFNRSSHLRKRFCGSLAAAHLLAFILGSATAASTAPPQTSDIKGQAKIRLRITGLPDPGSTEPTGVAKLRVQQEFLRLHPNVELVSAEGIKLENVVSEVTTVMMVAGGIAPDVLQMNFRSADTFVRMGMVAPLDEFLDAEPTETREAILSRIPKQILPVVNRFGPDDERRIYGLPGTFLFTGLFFNRDLFQQAGLPPRAPKDWKEMLEFAKAIKAIKPKSRPIFLVGGADASWNLMSFLWSAGADAVVETQSGTWRAAFDTPEAVAAYEFYYQLVEADRLAVRSGKLNSPEELQKTGMFFGYVGDALRFDPEKFGFGPVPKGPTGLRGSEINSVILGMFSGIKDPAVRQAAWDYIQFVTSEEAERIKIETMVELGLADQINPIYLRKFGFDQYLSLVPKGLEESFREALETGRPEPYGRNCNLVYAEMTYPLDQILISSEIAELWQEGRFEEVRVQIAAILKTAVERTDERMLGYVPPKDMAFRRLVALAVVIVIVLTFLILGWRVSRIFTDAGRMTASPVASRGLLPWLCLAPALILVLVWHYFPLARGTIMAFQDYQLVLPSSFVGLDNFANVLFDVTFWRSLQATLHYAAWVLTVGFALPILLAYALHLIPRQKILFRIVYYLPAVISATAVFFLWRELFGLDGFLNQMLRMFGFEARRAWTEDPNLAMLSCVIPGFWAGVGPGCLIYLAALKTIPIEQFEAAEIDGAGFFQKTRLIVYPGLKGLILINLTGAVAASFHGATNILIMTGGGPNGATEVTSLLLFFEAFTRLRLGHATAMAWIIGSMLIGITVVQLQRLSRMEFKTAK